MSRRLLIGLCVACLGLVVPASAQMTWPDEKLSVDAGPNETLVTGTFHYRNEGTYPVKLLSVKPSCGCTKAQPSRLLCQPGESGTIAVELHVTNLAGEVSKTIQVTTNDPARKDVTLTITAVVREYVKIEPPVLSWEAGAPTEPKSFAITVIHPDPIHMTGVTLTDDKDDKDKFTYALQTLEDGRRYELTVTPRDTSDRHRIMLSLNTDFPRKNPLTFKLAAYVFKKYARTGTDRFGMVSAFFMTRLPWFMVLGLLVLAGVIVKVLYRLGLLGGTAAPSAPAPPAVGPPDKG